MKNKVENHQKHNYGLLAIMCRLYKIAFSVCPIRMFIYSMVLVANGMITVVITYFTQLFYDNVNSGIADKTVNNMIIISLIMLLASIFSSHILNGIDNYLGTTVRWNSGVFQNYQKYQMSVKDNIIISASSQDNMEDNVK